MKPLIAALLLIISSATFAQTSKKIKEATDTDFCPAFKEVIADEPNDYKNTVGQERNGDTWELQEVMPGAMRVYEYENMDSDVAFLMDANDKLAKVKEDFDKLKEWIKVCLGTETGYYTFKESHSPGHTIPYTLTVSKNDTKEPILKLRIMDNTEAMKKVSAISHKYYCVLEFI